MRTKDSRFVFPQSTISPGSRWKETLNFMEQWYRIRHPARQVKSNERQNTSTAHVATGLIFFMKQNILTLAALLATFIGLHSPQSCSAQTTAFTYQGLFTE